MVWSYILTDGLKATPAHLQGARSALRQTLVYWGATPRLQVLASQRSETCFFSCAVFTYFVGAIFILCVCVCVCAPEHVCVQSCVHVFLLCFV